MNQSSNMSENFTIRVPPQDPYQHHLVKLYMKFELVSTVFLCLMSIITVVPNCLLLTAIWRNPGKSFRTASTSFVVGLAVADLLTGLTTEPFFAAYYLGRYLNTYHNHDLSTELLNTLYNVGGSVSTIAISSSFLIVLALTWSQFVAISYPHKYKLWVTQKRAVICVVASYIYFIGFTMLQFSGMDWKMFRKIDLAIHPTLVSILLSVTLVLLGRAYRQKIHRSNTPHVFPQNAGNAPNSTSRKANLERQFTIVTIYLAGILLISALPHVFILHCFLYCKDTTLKEKVTILIAMRIKDLLLFLKVSLDAFIYAWRLPTYRSALKEVIGCYTIGRYMYNDRQRSRSPTQDENGSKL